MTLQKWGVDFFHAPAKPACFHGRNGNHTTVASAIHRPFEKNCQMKPNTDRNPVQVIHQGYFWF
jgi:hypothetical protein